jgi:hypothetical protein
MNNSSLTVKLSDGFYLALSCIFSFLLFVPSQLQAQQDFCGTEEANQRILNNNLDLQHHRDSMQEEVREYINNNRDKIAKRARADGNIKITIPVVFHVVYNSSSENVSTADIESQLKILNEDFRLLNDDTTVIRDTFRDVAADVEIEFCKAVRDPNGDTTNGITRTPTSHGAFGTDDDMKFDSQGGKDGWPRDEYLNIWICELTSGLLGYAYFPSSVTNNPDIDGVVIDYATVGENGYNNGRTATHEVGHYLSLYHTFQGNCNGSSSTDCNSGGDYICDTPQQNGSQSGCDFTDNTCTDSPTDYPDMRENHMSYSTCRVMYTQEQKSVMHWTIDNYSFRAALANSDGCRSFCNPPVVSGNYPFQEGFEDTTLPASWRLVNSNDANSNWEITTDAGGFDSSEVSNRIKFHNINEGVKDYMHTHTFDLTRSDSLELTFDVAHCPDDNFTFDSLLVYRMDYGCDTLKERMWAKGGEALSTAQGIDSPFIPEAGEWRQESISLLNFDQDSLRLSFVGKSNNGNVLYLDNINIQKMKVSSGVPGEIDEQIIQIYPNPSSGKVHLELNHEPHSLNVQVLNVVGERVYHQQLNSSKQNIDLSDQPGGLYLMKFYDDQGTIVETRKLYLSDFSN